MSEKAQYKIGILTYHENTINTGSLLQAHSIYNLINDIIESADVEIIDYRSRNMALRPIFGMYLSRFSPLYISKFFNYHKSILNNMKKKGVLSKKRMITNDNKKALDFIKEQNYDMIVVGSDVVWSIYNNQRWYTFYNPYPNPYFLDSSIDAIKVSYAAASSSSTSLSTMSKAEINKLRRRLCDFDKISVRGAHAEKLTKKLGITNVTRVPDPTIVYELPDIEVSDKLMSLGVDFDKPIMGTYKCRELTKSVCKHYRDKGYQIVAMHHSKYADVNLYGKLTPLEYYSAHKHFDMVVSGSLHSTIFSIKNNTPFVTLDSSKLDTVDKKESLLDDFSLRDRHIKLAKEKDQKSIFRKIENCEKELDRKHVNKRLIKLRKIGLDYLNEVKELLYGER